MTKRKAKKKKPAPISMKLHREPVRPPQVAPELAPFQPAQGINEISPIVGEQMERAEKDIDALRTEIKELRNAPPPTIEVTPPTSQVVLPERPRITKVTIKYDQLGYPTELIPQYSEPTV